MEFKPVMTLRAENGISQIQILSNLGPGTNCYHYDHQGLVYFSETQKVIV